MKHFLELVRVAKEAGKIIIMEEDGKDDIRSTGKSVKMDQFWDIVEKSSPIVFSRSPKPISELPEIYGGESFDLPFSVVSLEMLGDIPLTDARPDDEAQVKVWCVLVAEQIINGEFKYFIVSLITFWDRKEMRTRSTVVHNVFCSPIVKTYLDRIHKDSVGTELTNTKIKIGTGKSKRFTKIRRIVHVRDKKTVSKDFEYGSRNIDWSHRWLVRGHWRNFNGLGKDREGNYCINGKTWVVAHEKGPEDMPLIKKTRLVKKGG